MSRVSTYLNFMGDTEEAFTFYASVFGTEPSVPIMRMGTCRHRPVAPALVGARAVHGHARRAADPGRPRADGHRHARVHGHALRIGNNTTLNLEPDTAAEGRAAVRGAVGGGSDTVGLDPMPWGSLWGVTLDRFGIRWMFM